MKKIWKRTGLNMTAAVLCASLGFNSLLPVMAAEAADKESSEKREADKENKAETVNKETGKDETVYVKLNPDGSAKSITVSDWLKNPDKTAALCDKSDLSDIKNVKGTEGYAPDKDGTLIWSSGGNDIYYQGSTDKALPVSVKITYYLDGKEISASDLAGKSGKVKIRYDFTNHAIQDVAISGKTERIATPFAVVTGMILPGEHFENVEVSSGKVISDGSKMIVAGMAFPGLKDSLKLSDSELDGSIELPDYIEVTADATDFELEMAASVITSSIFDEIGIGDISSMDELSDALGELTDASNALVDGSGELLDGVLKLQDASGEFKDGINTLKDGAQKLKSGSEGLKNGVNEYTSGADELDQNVQKYADGSTKLAEGAKQYAAGASKLSEGVQELANKTASLPEVLSGLNTGVGKIQKGADALADETNSKKLKEGSQAVADGIASLHDNIVQLETIIGNSGDAASAKAAIELAAGYVSTIYANDSAVLANLNDAQNIVSVVDGYAPQASQKTQDMINSVEGEYKDKLDTSIERLSANVEMEKKLLEEFKKFDGSADSMPQLMDALKQMELATAAGTQNSLYDGAVSVADGVSEIVDGNKALKAGVDALAVGIGRLTIEAGALPEGISQLTEGSDELMRFNNDLVSGSDQILEASPLLKAGAGKLSGNSKALRKGALDLFEGAVGLSEGTNTLGSGTAQLEDGISQLADGAKQLNDGMIKFDHDGIEKLTETLENDAEGLIDRMQAVIKAGQEYQIFTDLPDDMKGSVKFIIETERIKAEK